MAQTSASNLGAYATGLVSLVVGTVGLIAFLRTEFGLFLIPAVVAALVCGLCVTMVLDRRPARAVVADS